MGSERQDAWKPCNLFQVVNICSFSLKTGDWFLMVEKILLPSSKSMIDHVVAVISDAGGRAKSADIDRRLLEKLGISAEAAAILHKDGEIRSEFCYRSAWARTYCRQLGLISKEPGGFWALANS